MGAERSLIRTLTLPYESVKTLYEGDSEVRLYRNELIGELQVGKRYDTLGLESTVLVNEGQLLKQIDHSQVVPVRDVVVPSGYQSPMKPVELIMPYYERGSLADAFLAGERFTIGEAIAMLGGALLGLGEIHECYGVLHRDLKSPNLFLTDEGRLLVGDLGVAIDMDADGGGEALPSPRLYCPPETFTLRRSDRRSDLFQMGVVLQELSSGPLPYDDPAYATEKMAERLAKGHPAVLPRHMRPAPWVPAGLRRVITKASHVDAGHRYGTAKQMGDALSKVRYIDWREVIAEPKLRRWEGATARRPDRRFAVEARRRGRGDGWVLVAQQSVNSWRRIVGRPDQIVVDLNSAQAASFFKSIVDIATRV
jgi:eukaryotic-like serine/threonine-protein kinase